MFRDVSDPGKVTQLKQSKQGDVDTLSFDKQYAGADFIVHETFLVGPKDVRWNVSISKTSGPDRTVRVIYDVPLPLGGEAWAPISNAPFRVKPWLPFSIDYGRINIRSYRRRRMENDRSVNGLLLQANRPRASHRVSAGSPAVRIRFLTNTSAAGGLLLEFAPISGQ